MSKVDLHLHTTFSDGTLSPTKLIQLCAKRKLTIVSVTDHDSTEGIPEAFAAATSIGNLEVIPGIELSTDVPNSEVHLLGYFVNFQDSKFQKRLLNLREGRQDRAQKMVQKLNALGIKISWTRVKELAEGAAIGRPHIARAMVESGYVKYPRDAFDHYLGRNGPAYAERLKLHPVSAVEMLIQNGAIPVLAHPSYFKPDNDIDQVVGLKQLLAELKEAGLEGMEVHYGDYSKEQTKIFSAIAKDLELIPCGGSDYHASGNPNEPEPGSVGPPINTVDLLRSIGHQHPPKN